MTDRNAAYCRVKRVFTRIISFPLSKSKPARLDTNSPIITWIECYMRIFASTRGIVDFPTLPVGGGNFSEPSTAGLLCFPQGAKHPKQCPDVTSVMTWAQNDR